MAPAIAILLSLLAGVGPVLAQATKQSTKATPLSQAAGTVTTGGTFQQVLAANAARSACLVQNTSTHVGYLWWQTSGTPSLLNTYQLAAGASWNCQLAAGFVVRSAIQYTTGTTADPFNVADFQ
jgi:hypothetical protein